MNWQRNRSRIKSGEFRFFTLFDDICDSVNAKNNETKKNIRTLFDYWANIIM